MKVKYLLRLKTVQARVIVIYIPQCVGSTLIQNTTEGDDTVTVSCRTELQCTHHERSALHVLVDQPAS